jgi:hypothetical protein
MNIYGVSFNQTMRWHLVKEDEESRNLNAEELGHIAEVLNIIMMIESKYSELKVILCQE